jgi:hypothetical protein
MCEPVAAGKNEEHAEIDASRYRRNDVVRRKKRP